MLKKYYLLLLISFLCHDIVVAEKNQYDLLWKNNVIGIVTTERSETGDLIRYSIKTEVTVNVGLKQHVEYLLENTFRKDTLQTAILKQYRNEDLSQSANTHRITRAYEFKKENKTKIINKPLINFTVAMLYFNEPLKAKSIYSENWGQHLVINAVGNHTYQLVQPNGKVNTYIYKNGLCQSITLNTTFYTITLKLKK